MEANTILSDIDACVFDAYGTLFDVNAATGRCRDALGEAADGVSELWRRKQLEYSWLRSLRGDYVDFWHVTGEALDFALSAFGINDFAAAHPADGVLSHPRPLPRGQFGAERRCGTGACARRSSRTVRPAC